MTRKVCFAAALVFAFVAMAAVEGAAVGYQQGSSRLDPHGLAGRIQSSRPETVDGVCRIRETATDAEEPKTQENGSMEYLGDWIITAYCGCSECCGSFGNATASGAYPVPNHTVACNVLPFFTQIMIDGTVYTVEDTGYTPYGDAWIDIYFDSHEEAEAFGLQIKPVYLVG